MKKAIQPHIAVVTISITMTANDHHILLAYKTHLHLCLSTYFLVHRENIKFLKQENINDLSLFLCNILHIEQGEKEEISLVEIQQIIESPITFVSLIGSMGIAKEIYGAQLPQFLLLAKQLLELDLQAKKMETLLLLFNDAGHSQQETHQLVKDIPDAEVDRYFEALSRVVGHLPNQELVVNSLHVLDDIKQNTRRIRNLGGTQVWAIHRTAQLLHGLNDMIWLAKEPQCNEIRQLLTSNKRWFYQAAIRG